MKKLCAFLLMALLMVPVWAGADDYFIPDPGHFFGETMVKTSGRNYTMYFDEDPRDMFNAYVSLLQTDYEMKKLSITDTDHIFTYDGVNDSGVTISYISGKDGYRIDVSLHSLVSTGKREQYDPDWSAEEEPAQQKSAAKGQIAWDDGRMIADPGDFLGYEIKVLEIAAGNNAGGGFMKYTYEAIPIDDILALADAINASPFFKRNSSGSGSLNDKYFWLICHDYTGPDKELAALCKNGRAERYGRSSDLSIYIFDPDQSKSTFAIYEYPGFTINSTMAPKREDHDQAGDSCSFCDGDGKCNECGGTSWVWVTEFVFNDDGFPVLETNNKFCGAIYCNGGSCTECGGSGQK